MKPSRIIRPFHSFILLILLLAGAGATFAQVGTLLPDNAPLSDQKLGSVLLFNYFKSNAANLAASDTKISLTNTNASSLARVALYFIIGNQTHVLYVCLAPNQSTSFQMGEIYPGDSGALLAVAVDPNGFPLKFNYLSGNATLKFPNGYTGSYNAIAITKLTTTNPPSTTTEPNVTAMNFDGVSYNQLPAVLALDHVPAIADGNETIFVLNQWNGNLGKGYISDSHGNRGAPPDAIGTMQDTVYSPTGLAATWAFSGTSAQYLKRISDTVPNIPGGMMSWIPATTSGWMKFWPTGTLNKRSYTGLVMYYRANASTTYGAFVGIRNLPHQTLTTSTISIPRIIPTC